MIFDPEIDPHALDRLRELGKRLDQYKQAHGHEPDENWRLQNWREVMDKNYGRQVMSLREEISMTICCDGGPCQVPHNCAAKRSFHLGLADRVISRVLDACKPVTEEMVQGQWCASIPIATQETNLVWLRREMEDVRDALARLERAMEKVMG